MKTGTEGLQKIPELGEGRVIRAFESWNLPEVPLAIECSAEALEDIRSQAWEGLRKLARRGLEIGGILYGTRRWQSIRIEAVRPIACQHEQGPGFVLSQPDHAALQEQIEHSENDPDLKLLIPLGWFVSHTRGGTELTAADLEIYSTYFPEPWQVTLVVHPRHGATSGAFFVRRDDGQAKVEFEFPHRRGSSAARAEAHRRPEAPASPPVPLHSPPMPANSVHSEPRHEGEGGIRLSARPAAWYGALKPARLEPAALKPARLEPAVLKPAPRKAKPARRRLFWVWVAMCVLALGGLGWAAVRLVQENLPAQPLALDLLDNNGQLRIEWNAHARPVAKAVRGWLYIADGEDLSTVDLNAHDLASGSLAYERRSGSVEVRLRVENVWGHTEEEDSRFVGAAPVKRADPEALKALEQQRRDLQAEVARLRAEKAAQARRIADLEAAERALRARVR